MSFKLKLSTFLSFVIFLVGVVYVSTGNIRESLTSELDKVSNLTQLNSTLGTYDNSEYYRVYDVVDGDTFKVLMNNEKTSVRILGIDTPETKKPNTEVQCYGQEASDKLKNLILNKEVILQKDSVQGDEDKYGRKLRFVELNGEDIGAQLLKEGYAHLYTKEKTVRFDAYKKLEDQAKSSNLGLWGNCSLKY